MKNKIGYWQSLMILACVLILAACNIEQRTVAPVQTRTEVSETQLPIRTDVPPTDPEPSTDPVPSPTTPPTQPPCNTDFVVFLTKDIGIPNVDHNGVYLACSDGSGVQRIVAEREILPDPEWKFTDIAVSPDGETLALIARGSVVAPLPHPNIIYLVNMHDYSVTELYAPPNVTTIGGLLWSPDTEYLLYGVYTIENVQKIEMLHVDTQTISRIIDPSTSAPFLRVFGWLPDSSQILFSSYYSGNPGVHTAYLANVACDDVTHTCALTSQTEVGWLSSHPPDSLSLLPDASGFVEDKFVNNVSFLEVRDFSGSLQLSININEEYGISFRGFDPPSVSSDGSRIAFTALAPDSSLDDVFIYSLADMSLVNVTDDQPLLEDVAVERVLWVP